MPTLFSSDSSRSVETVLLYEHAERMSAVAKINTKDFLIIFFNSAYNIIIQDLRNNSQLIRS